MTTSTHQRMHRISPNNPVRRRLIFGDTVDDQARVDNFANILQESIVRDRAEKSKKWNFDFAKEVALEGDFIWYMKDKEGEWIGIKPKRRVPYADKFTPIQINNENTPVQVRDESVPMVRKRKNEVENRVAGQSVKRKVNFE